MGTSINDDVHYVRRVFCDLIKARTRLRRKGIWCQGARGRLRMLASDFSAKSAATRSTEMASSPSSMNWCCHLIAWWCRPIASLTPFHSRSLSFWSVALAECVRIALSLSFLELHTFQFVAAAIVVHVISASVSANGSRWHATDVCTYLTHTHAPMAALKTYTRIYAYRRRCTQRNNLLNKFKK